LQVIKDEDQGASLGGVFQKGGEAIEEAEALLGWLQCWQAGQIREALTDFRYHLGQRGGSGTYLRLESLGTTGRQIVAYNLDPGPERGRPLPFITASP
jgi:hypothetical protein